MPAYKFQGVQSTAIAAQRMVGALGTEILPRLIMTGIEHDMLPKFLIIKIPSIIGSKIEDAFEITIDYYERLHKNGIAEQHNVEFVTF